MAGLTVDGFDAWVAAAFGGRGLAGEDDLGFVAGGVEGLTVSVLSWFFGIIHLPDCFRALILPSRMSCVILDTGIPAFSENCFVVRSAVDLAIFFKTLSFNPMFEVH